MVTLLRDHVAVTRQAPFGHMVTQQRDHATRRDTLNTYPDPPRKVAPQHYGRFACSPVLSFLFPVPCSRFPPLR
jgi:hypothetical protein